MNDSRQGASAMNAAAPSWLTDFEQQSVAVLLGRDNPRTRETLAKLARLGIKTVSELLFHLPFRYEDRTQVTAIGDLAPGITQVVVVRVNGQQSSRPRTRCFHVSDDGGSALVRFYHTNPLVGRYFQEGQELRLTGAPRLVRGRFEFAHPEMQLVADFDDSQLQELYTPFYRSTEGLHQLQLRRLIGQALKLAQLRGGLAELLPEDALPSPRISLTEALATIHQPPRELDSLSLIEGENPASERLALEEMVTHRLGLMRQRCDSDRHATAAIARGRLGGKLLQSLPFTATGAQSRVLEEIYADLASGRPMRRLLQGDVGSGKTLVAALAALAAAESGWQVAFMAPTNLLSDQHGDTLRTWLEPLGIRVRKLSGKMSAPNRRSLLGNIQSGEDQIIVGTHALFQESVRFKKLGLVIVDEQHRFGVEQRAELQKRGGDPDLSPHLLSMTATPIPRTLAMIEYADLDHSLLDEMPPGREDVETAAIAEHRRGQVIERLAQVLAQGNRAYWVCPLIDESEELEAQSVKDAAAELKQQLPAAAVAILHGRMKPDEKQSVLEDFRRGHISLLVATVIVEVGVDVPEATIMVIENSERKGLTQLHQLRGRVGRGHSRGYCVLLHRSPLSDIAHKRLETLRTCHNGSDIAERDLDLRGPGELLGQRQTGTKVNMKITNLARHRPLLPQVKDIVERLLAENEPQRWAALSSRWLSEASEEVG